MAKVGMGISREDLVAMLDRQILTGALPAGSPLPSERQLAERFAVSRPVVREALRALSERRLVRIEIGRGAFVRESDPTAAATVLATSIRGRNVTARHVIDGRRLIEVETARLAAEHRGTEDLERMEQALHSLHPDDPLLDRVRADLRFHLAVARASHNPVLEAMLGAISGLAAELMVRSLSDPDVAREGVPQHAQILAAIADKDVTTASSRMCEHLDLALSKYGADLDDNLDTVAERRMREDPGPDRSLDDLFRIATGADQI